MRTAQDKRCAYETGRLVPVGPESPETAVGASKGVRTAFETAAARREGQRAADREIPAAGADAGSASADRESVGAA